MIGMTYEGIQAAMAQAQEKVKAAYGGTPNRLEYQHKERAGNFSCPACQVGENNAKVANYFTPWTCWACGDDQKTLPRPLMYPDPAV